MLDIKFIRDNVEVVRNAIINKHLSDKVDVDTILNLDKEYKELLTQVDEIRKKRNELNEKVKYENDQATKEKLIIETTNLKPQEKELTEKLAGIKVELDANILNLPNITSPKMPVGKNEDDNQVLRNVGDVPVFDFTPKDHVELGQYLDLIDVEKPGEITGSRFCYLKNEAVMLQFAIISMVFKELTNPDVMKALAEKVKHPNPKPFVPMLPPIMMKPEIMKKMDRLDPIDERYQTTLDQLMLVGSAEHTMGPYHMDEILRYDSLPIRYIGYSVALRREAGSYGKDVRGILRAHQFDKLEMETFVPEEYGEVEQDLIVAIQEHLVSKLNIPYRVIQICTGDTGKPDYNQYDIECWIPSQERYRETHTSDYMTDYQSRRLNIKYADKSGDKKFVHMNDATAFALGRIIIAILENNQQKDGSVVVPEVLRDYVGKEIITPK